MSRRHTDTSSAAYAGMHSATARLERIVLKALHANPMGLTVDETCEAMGFPRYSLQPRFTALRDRRAIYDTGRRRLNVSGAKAIVWRVAALDVGEAVR